MYDKKECIMVTQGEWEKGRKEKKKKNKERRGKRVKQRGRTVGEAGERCPGF